MAFSINEFKSQLVGGGARSALFQVQITNPILGVADFKVPFMVKTAAIPESSTGVIPVPYFGRIIKYGGDRTFGAWPVTIINDEDFAVRNAMEAWSNAINSHITNFRSSPFDYKAQAQVTQYGKDGSVLREYTFEGLFPISISTIDLSWQAQDQIEEFGVTFEYDLWRISGGVTGNSTT
jgi:hypothetical protein